jgi:ABC-type uncharacterized transport system substrate-binding protein
MIKSLLRLWLAALLIIAASAVLVLTDRERPRSGAGLAASSPDAPVRVRSIALFQQISQEAIDDAARGVLAGLAAAGYFEGQTLRVHPYNAGGDAATSNTIAQTIIGGDDELVITLSTPSLQAVAGANRDAKRPHVFGMVSDPVSAGVGIARDDPREHLPYMVGVGTMPPVAEGFRMARRLAPGLKRVGVAWNPSEVNSEASTKIARTVCKELGIELLEASVDSSAVIAEAVAGLVGRGAEAIWIGGDNMVIASVNSVIGPTQRAGVPVFTCAPGCAAQGAVFDLGADYYRVGESVGRLAARVLDGESPADIAIEYEVPPELWINRAALAGVKGGWSLPPQVDAAADVVVEKGGPVRRHPHQDVAALAAKRRRPSRTWKVGLAAYSESPVLEEAIEGLRRGLKESGLVDGKDYTMTYRNAQGDIATLNALFDEFSGNEIDLVISFSTPALQAALRKIDRKPLVFGLVLDPFAAGAGKSDSDHPPTVTGVYLAFPYGAMARTIRQVLPKARRVGTLFTPGEINSVVARRGFEAALKREAIELVSVPVNGPTEVSDAALSLCQSGIDVLGQIADNMSSSSFPAIARACETAKMPLFTFSPSYVKGGAMLGVGSDYAENGRETGLVAAEVIRGKDPGSIPFHATAKTNRSINLGNARRLGMEVPQDWMKSAEVVGPVGKDGR